MAMKIKVNTSGKSIEFICNWLPATPEDLQKAVDSKEIKLSTVMAHAHANLTQAAKNVARPIMASGGSDDQAIKATNDYNPDTPKTRIGATPEQKAENAARKQADTIAIQTGVEAYSFDKLDKKAQANLVASHLKVIKARIDKAESAKSEPESE